MREPTPIQIRIANLKRGDDPIFISGGGTLGPDALARLEIEMRKDCAYIEKNLDGWFVVSRAAVKGEQGVQIVRTA